MSLYHWDFSAPTPKHPGRPRRSPVVAAPDRTPHRLAGLARDRVAVHRGGAGVEHFPAGRPAHSGDRRPTPVPMDGVRRIANRFRGRLGAAIAAELVWRGADAELLLGDGAWCPTKPLRLSIARTFDAYCDGVADYRPRQAVRGKIPSGQAELMLALEPTEKVIDLACEAALAMACVAFNGLGGVGTEAQKRWCAWPQNAWGVPAWWLPPGVRHAGQRTACLDAAGQRHQAGGRQAAHCGLRGRPPASPG